MQVDVDMLKGAALDYAVATGLGYQVTVNSGVVYDSQLVEMCVDGGDALNFHENWAITGPLVDRFNISIQYLPYETLFKWGAVVPVGMYKQTKCVGSTALEAALRAQAFSRHGVCAEIPEEFEPLCR